MISEAAQERATLYALALLDADEAVAFERELDADAELRTVTVDLRETVASLALSAEGEPPAGLQERVMARLAADKQTAAGPARAPDDLAPDKVVAGPWGGTWLPWALAAMLMVCCGVLAVSRQRLRREFAELEHKTAAVEVAVARLHDAGPAPEADPLRRVVFCPLEPTPQLGSPPQVAVLWDAVRREGKLRVSRLPSAGAGKDYQLWVVEDGHKDAVSAGVVSPGDGGTVEVPFQPVATGGKEAAVAFALSVERAGGSPKNEGPILFLGKL